MGHDFLKHGPMGLISQMIYISAIRPWLNQREMLCGRCFWKISHVFRYMRKNFFVNIAKESSILLDFGEIFVSLNAGKFLKIFLKRRSTISEISGSNIWHETFCDRLLETKSCSVGHNMLCTTTNYTSEMSFLCRYVFSMSTNDSELIWMFKLAIDCFGTSIGHHSHTEVQSKLCNKKQYSHVKYGEERRLICSECNAN